MAKPARTRATRATPSAPAGNISPFPASPAERARLRNRRRAAAFDSVGERLAFLLTTIGLRPLAPGARALLDAYLNTNEYGRRSLLVAAEALRTNFPYHQPHA